jgi:hypothetical protein
MGTIRSGTTTDLKGAAVLPNRPVEVEQDLEPVRPINPILREYSDEVARSREEIARLRKRIERLEIEKDLLLKLLERR